MTENTSTEAELSNAVDSSEDPETMQRVAQLTETTEPEETGKVGSNAEAAKYRRQLRDAETERDALGETVTRMQRAEVQRLTADQLEVPEDLFTVGGIDLVDLVDESGDVDPGLVSTASYGLLEQRPGLARSAPRQKGPILGGMEMGKGALGTSWQDVLRR